MICVIIASLIECFLILPMHLRSSLEKKRKRQPFRLAIKVQAWFDRLGQVHFRRLSQAAVRRCGVTLSLGFGSFVIVISLVIGGYVKFTFFPSPAGTLVDMNVAFVSGTPTKTMVKQISQIESEAWALSNKLKESNRGQSVLNTSAVFIHKNSSRSSQKDSSLYSSIVFDLVPPEKRKLTNAEFIKLLKQHITLTPDIESLTLSAPRSGPPGSDLSSWVCVERHLCN